MHCDKANVTNANSLRTIGIREVEIRLWNPEWASSTFLFEMVCVDNVAWCRVHLSSLPKANQIEGQRLQRSVTTSTLHFAW